MTAVAGIIRRLQAVSDSLGTLPEASQIQGQRVVLDGIIKSLGQVEDNLVVVLETNRRVEEAQTDRIDLLESQLASPTQRVTLLESQLDDARWAVQYLDRITTLVRDYNDGAGRP